MYLSLKNPIAPDFLNAAAAAAGILQLSINSVSDIRRREICPRTTFFCGTAGAACLFLTAVFPATGTSLKDSLVFFFSDTLKKTGSILLLMLLAKISHGGIGFGDIRSLLSLACCCSFSAWAASLLLGFLFTFFPAAVLFLTAHLKSHGHSIRSRGIPFLPFLLASFLLVLWKFVHIPGICNGIF